MKWFSNLKIRSKMLVGFGTIIILLVLLSAYSLVQMRNIEDSFSYAISHPMHGEVRILEFKGAVREFRRITATILPLAYLSDFTQINDYHQLALAAYNAGIEALDRFDEGMRVDPRVPQEVIDAVLADTAAKRRLFHDYRASVYVPLVAAARIGNAEGAMHYLVLGTPISEALASSIDELLGLANAVATEEIENATRAAERTFNWLVLSAVIITLVSVVMAIFVSFVTSKPIRKLHDIVSAASEGKVNLNIDRANISRDEIGMLTSDICRLVDVIKSIVDDLATMEREFNVVGDYEHRIDVSKYKN